MSERVDCPNRCGAKVLPRGLPRHMKRQCKGPLEKQVPRKCGNLFRDCEEMFVPNPKHPTQEYCSHKCRKQTGGKLLHDRRKTHHLRGRPSPGSSLHPIDREELQMAQHRLRDAEVRLQVAQTGNAMLARQERSHALRLALLGVPS